MPTYNPIYASFASGELSPSLWGRVDIDKYRSGLRTARNLIIHPQGGGSNRCGFKYIDSTKYTDSYAVSTEFIFSQTQAYFLEFGHLYVRFYTDGQRIENDGVAYEVSTPYTHSDLSLLRFESSADVIWITHPDYKTKTLSRYENANWVLDDYEPEDGPFMPENIDDSISMTASAVSGNITLTVSSSISIDSQTVLLCHANGTNNSTTFTDDAGNTITANGNAKISTTQNKFGGSSLLLDGSGDYLSVSDSDSWDLGTGDFTIECFVYFNILPTASNRAALFNHYDGSLGQNGDWFFEIFNSAGTYQFRWGSYNSGFTIISKNISSLSLSTWYHFRVIRVSNTIRFFKDGVQVGTDGSDSTDLTRAGSTTLNIGDFIGGSAGISAYIDEMRISKGVARNSGGSFTVPTSEFSVSSIINSGYTFSQLHIGALFKLKHYIESQTVSTGLSSSTTTSSIKCFTTWRLITHGTWTGKLRVEKSVNGGTTWTVLRTFSSSNDFNADTSGTEDIEINEEPFLVRVNMYSYSSGTANVDLTTDAFYQDGIVRVTSFNNVSSVQADVLKEIGLTSATTSWAEGSWSDYRGYPSCARFFQDRLCFANTYSEPQTVWMTETSNYYSFIRHSSLLDSDGITINLPSRQLNSINSLIAFNKLLATTSSSVWSITSSEGASLTPTTVKTDIEEYTGSSVINPVVVGVELFVNEFGGDKVRNISYQLSDDAFVGSESNVLANHFFEGYTILKMAYLRKPNNMVLCLRSDGVIISLTYLREQNIVAWAKHDTDGTIEDMSVLPGENSDELWIIVSRDNGKFIELMEGRRQFNIDDNVYLDSYIHTQDNTAVVSGLTNLASQIVGVIGDDVYLDTYTVSASGTLAVSTSYDDLYIGLPYNTDLETLNIEVASSNGSQQLNKIKVGNINLRLLNTRDGLYIGNSSSNLYEALTYSVLNSANLNNGNSTLGTTEKFTGDIRIPLGAGYSKGGRIFLRNSKPLPFTVSAIIPELDVGGPGGG